MLSTFVANLFLMSTILLLGIRGIYKQAPQELQEIKANATSWLTSRSPNPNFRDGEFYRLGHDGRYRRIK